MPVSVTANGQASPPRFEITITTTDGTAMTAVSLVRSVGGVRSATRVQPSTGVASRYIEDPEADWDAPVTYIATITSTAGTEVASSAPATLTPDPAAVWAIHPTVPGRSMALDVADFTVAGLAALGDITRAAQATQHPIIASPLPVLTKIGNRRAPAGSLELTTTSLAEKVRLQSLTNDETPVLIRVPDGWGWGWEAGFYALGDLTEVRRIQYGADPSRTWRIPFQKVAAPAGTQQSSWSWGGLATHYADWGAVANLFDDWNAVAGNSPDA